jgi:hypothetical protein
VFVDGQHVSIGAATVDELLDQGREPADWSLGFAVRSPAVWIWAPPRLVAVLGDPPTLEQPPAPAELEDFVEACAKALRAADPVALRLAARSAGETAVPLVRDLNEPVAVSTREEAARAALALSVAPDGWADDLAALLGLAAADDGRVLAAVRGVGAGVLRLLRERGVEAQPELATYLHDGTLERHLGFRP